MPVRESDERRGPFGLPRGGRHGRGFCGYGCDGRYCGYGHGYGHRNCPYYSDYGGINRVDVYPWWKYEYPDDWYLYPDDYPFPANWHDYTNFPSKLVDIYKKHTPRAVEKFIDNDDKENCVMYLVLFTIILFLIITYYL